MTSKLVVNTIEADTGISSVSFASSISLSSTSVFHFGDAGLNIGADTNINRPGNGVIGFNINGAEKVRIDSNGHMHGVGVVTATHFYGNGANLTNLPDTDRITEGNSFAEVLDTGTNGIFRFVSEGNERLRITHDAKVGINTNNPSAPLEIQGDNGINDAAIYFTRHGNPPNDGVIGQLLFRKGTDSVAIIEAKRESANDDAYLKFQTQPTGGNVTERLRIGSTGKVSIGDVATHTFSAHSEGDDLVIGGAGWRGMTIYGEGGGGVIQFADNGDNRVGQIMYYHAENSMSFRVNGNQTRLKIDSSGNVMIGRTDGAKKFSVKESSTSSGVHFAQTIGGSSHVSGYAVGLGFDPEGYSQRNKIAIVAEGTGNGYSRGKLHFLLDNNNNSSEVALNNSRMFITDDGQIGMGAPSTYTDPYRLYLRYYYNHSAGYANGLVIDARPDALTTKHIRFYYALHGSGGGSELGSVTSSNAGSVSYNTSSDYRRKKNDVAITDGIEKVKRLRPIRFNWIEQPEITEEGFFAHEAQEVVPNSVFGEKDALDNDGKPDYQVMDHSKLVPLLTASIKDLITKVETLESEVAALKGS